jgi:tetratricopeptide (TPR) repeat protein
MTYRAFISYSHSDSKTVAALHRWLEGYRLPGDLRLRDGAQRLAPIFRDRDELPTSADLGSQLTAALEASETLIVFCSPASAASRWVNEEAATFIRLGRHNRIIAVLIDGDTRSNEHPSNNDSRFLPPSLRAVAKANERVDGFTQLDLREGRAIHAADRLRLAAAVAGVDAYALEREHLGRGMRRIAAGVVSALAVTAGLAGLAGWATQTAAEAVKETARATAARDESLAAADLAKKAEAEALTKEHTATQTADFFVSMFAAPNAPPLAGNMLFAELLEKACRRLIPTDGTAPEIANEASRASLLVGFAQALGQLGRSQIADEAMSASLAGSRGAPQEPGADATTLLVAAQAAINSSQFNRALQYLNDAQVARRSTGCAPDLLDVRIASSTAHCLLRTKGDSSEVEACLQMARDALLALDGEVAKPELVSLLRVEALHAGEQLRDKATATRRLREALAICSEESYAGDSRDWPDIALNIVEFGHESPPDLVSLAKKAAQLTDDLVGSHHPRALYARILFASALQKDRRPLDAVNILQPLMNVVRSSKNDVPEGYARAVSVLAYSLTELGRVLEAKPLLDELIQHHESRHDINSPAFTDALELKALVLRRERRYAEALDIANRALAILEASEGRQSPELWDPLSVIAECHSYSGQHEPQIATLKRLLAILEQSKQSTSDKAAQVHMSLAIAYAATGDAEQRQHHAFQAVDVCEQAGVKGYLLADTLAVKGMMLCFPGKQLVEGLPVLEKALRVAIEAIGTNDPRIQSFMKSLQSAAVAAGTEALLAEELGTAGSPEPLFAASASAIQLLASEKALGKTMAREAHIVLSEQAAQAAEGALPDEPELASSLASRGEAWLGPPTTADSPRARATRSRLALTRAHSDLISGRAPAVVARLEKDREANALSRELLLTLAVAHVLEGHDNAAEQMLAECDLKGRDSWPAWVTQSMKAIVANDSIADALHRVEKLAKGD